MRFDAVIFGLYETGLGVARSLGIHGLKTVGIDHKKDLGYYSKYITPLICPHPISQEDYFLEWVVEHFKDIEQRLPVFLTSDDFLLIFSKNRELLSNYFHFNLNSHSLLIKIADKFQQATLASKAGIEVPRTHIISRLSDVYKVTSSINYPVIIKGLDVNLWRKYISYQIKGYRVNNATELVNKLKEILNYDMSVVVQEIILGDDRNHFKYNTYISSSRGVLAEFMLRKIRQNPPHFGVGAIVESYFDPDLLNLGRALFRQIGFKGIGSAEFKLDQRDGKLKLIEINPRYWQQNYLATYCGINFPFTNYNDLKGIVFNENNNYKTGIKWVNRQLDLESFLQYRKEKEITFREWIISRKGEKVFSDFAWNDPVPALYNINFGAKLIKAPLFLIKNIF